MKQYTVGVDIGGTKCAVLLGDSHTPRSSTDRLLLDKIEFPTQVEKGPDYAINHICSAIDAILSRNKVNLQQVIAIGISSGGPLDPVNGIIQSPPNLHGWNNIPIVQIMQQRYGVDAYIENDANACALAEWRFGAARGLKNVIFLTFGTGMGAGLILNGRLFRGSTNMAGEVGHIRMAEFGPAGFGKAGSFEGFCSGGGIAQIARTKVTEQLQMGLKPMFCPSFEQLDDLTAKSVAEAAEQDDSLAKEIYEICGHYLGKGLAIMIDMLNPDIIILGSIYERSQALLWPAAERSLRSEALANPMGHCKIAPSMLGNQLGDIAAITVAINGGEERNQDAVCAGARAFG